MGTETMRRLYLALSGCIWAVTASCMAGPTSFFISPNGSDTNPGTQSRPFRTLTKAREVVRPLAAVMRDDITVVLRGGTYGLKETLVFDARDSGRNGHRVIYRNYSGEVPILSGGRKISGWSKSTNGLWRATTEIPNFRQLYIEGSRRNRACGGPLPEAKLEGTNGYRSRVGTMADWKHPEDIELCFYKVWCHTRCKVLGIHRQGSEAIITMLQPCFEFARNKEGVQVELPAYVENALELLDQPGQWYLDRRQGAVYYLPRPGEDLPKIEVIAPAVETLLELRGTLQRPVKNIRFEGLTFAYAGWLEPSRIGHVDVQANFTLGQENLLKREGKLTTVHNEHVKSPGNIVCHTARSVEFEGCRFTHLGGAGIDFEAGSQENVISGCEFTDISGSAIQVGGVRREDHHPPTTDAIIRNNTVSNNSIHDVAVEYEGGVGIFVGYTEGTRLVHNDLSRLPYSAISMGWGWGEEDAGGGATNYYQPFRYSTPTPSKNNVIAYNHIHHVMQKLQDGGAIYTLGNMPGTVIAWNYIHDNRGTPGGIYLDEGSGGIETMSNLVCQVATPMNYNNRSQNRIATCQEHDNAFDVSPEKLASPAMQRLIQKAGVEPAWRPFSPP